MRRPQAKEQQSLPKFTAFVNLALLFVRHPRYVYRMVTSLSHVIDIRDIDSPVDQPNINVQQKRMQRVRRDWIGFSVGMPTFGYCPRPRARVSRPLERCTTRPVRLVVSAYCDSPFSNCTCCGTCCRRRPVHPRTKPWRYPLGQ